MLQWPERRRRVISTPMPGRRKLSWSSVSSRLLTSKSSLMDSINTRSSSSQCCSGRGSGGVVSSSAKLRSVSGCTCPTARLNSWRSASSRAAASRRAFSSASARSRCSRNWRVMVARSCRPSTRTLGRRGLGALRGLGAGAGVPSARGAGAVRGLGACHAMAGTRRAARGGGGAAGAGGWVGRKVRAKAAASAPVSSCLGLSDGWPLGVSPGSGAPADGWRRFMRGLQGGEAHRWGCAVVERSQRADRPGPATACFARH